MTLKALVLREMGIECEEETFRALQRAGIQDVRYFGLSELFEPGWKERLGLDAQTWVWVPGGFSFSDDFGAGRLLAYWLKEQGFLDEVFAKGAHLTGICNGFQALCHMNVFGESTRLQPNAPRGFINRWVKVALTEGAEFSLPVRHGEGRLTVNEALPAGVNVFMKYQDDAFDNGSLERIAGLQARVKNSYVFGMMPHPEVALRPLENPAIAGTSRMPKFRSEVFDLQGGGIQVIRAMQEMILKGVS